MNTSLADRPIRVLIDGVEIADMNRALSIGDRGLQYGDGLFETMRLRAGRIQYLSDHMHRLALGCERLQIAMSAMTSIESQLATLIENQNEGVIKLIVTRGVSGRGYRPGAHATPSSIAALYQNTSVTALPEAIAIRWCKTTLGRNALLAGIKHLNRLEQVLAQAEWNDASIAEGLMLDSEGELICGTASNIFLANGGVLYTPDLRFSGIRGVMRGRILSAANELNISVEECALRPHDLLEASEVFVTNALRGIRPVIALDDKHWPIGALTQRLAKQLQLW